MSVAACLLSRATDFLYLQIFTGSCFQKINRRIYIFVFQRLHLFHFLYNICNSVRYFRLGWFHFFFAAFTAGCSSAGAGDSTFSFAGTGGTSSLPKKHHPPQNLQRSQVQPVEKSPLQKQVPPLKHHWQKPLADLQKERSYPTF